MTTETMWCNFCRLDYRPWHGHDCPHGIKYAAPARPDLKPLSLLTVGELRKLIREEVKAEASANTGPGHE